MRRPSALAADAADHQRRLERGDDRGEVLGRVGLAERAADGAAVAHDRVGDDPLGVVEDREVLAEDGASRAGSAWRVIAPMASSSPSTLM